MTNSSLHPQQFFFDRQLVQRHYDGVAGALTAITGWFNGHESLAGRLFLPHAFDVRGCKRILDAGCGNGRYSRFLLRAAPADARITAFDLSQKMLRRARKRLHSERVSHAAADLTRLPYPDSYFDAAVCGWVIEHLPDPRPGLRSLARVLHPDGKLLLLTTEETRLGWCCSRMWHCRTYRRADLRRACEESGLEWVREHWYTRLHACLRLGGIAVELRRQQ
jgi:ubiquinone/menaquinone biosynthesis C-methylase UbiE